MNEAMLRQLLREAPVPEAEGAERRGLALVEAAFAEQGLAEPAGRRAPSLPRLAIALAIATLVAALLLSPAGAAVRDWVDDVFTAQVTRQGPGLAEIPGGGRLLVQSQAGPWVVQPDGSRRLLGDFEEATWSPRGLFVATVAGDTLSAVEPDGTPRWSLSTGAAIADPRWSPANYPFRIAYRSGRGLRVTAADGTGDELIDPSVAPVAPAWSPLGPYLLAYVDAGGGLRIADTESGEIVASAAAMSGVERIEWASSGLILEASGSALRVRPATVSKLAQEIALGPARRLALPPGAVVRDTALEPSGKTIAAVLGVRNRLGPRGLLVLFAGGGGQRRLFNAPGRLSEVAWSPNDERLLIAWPSADQWLFLPAGGRQEGRSVTGVSTAFAPGEPSAAFPRVEGWCCHAR
jgi:hypothetical protein